MALHDALNLRREEVVPVSLLLFQSVFLGFFLGAFDVGANTLFLNSFEQSMIPKAIVISGITGIILTSLYSFLQNRLTFSNLAVLNLATVFVITFLLRAGYYFSDTKWLAFGLFVLMGPLNIIALVGFWGTVGRMFDLRQGKRIFGFIDTGQVVGVIISSLSVPFLINMGFQTKNLLYISAISIFLAVILQLFISAKYPQQLKIKMVKEKKKSNFIDTLRIPYVRTMALFVVFSMLVAFFVHYLFLSVARERFADPNEMATFFGGLMGTLTIVSVLIKTFVYGPLMKTYGLKISLLISPVIMIIITVSAALVGSAFGYTVESGTFTFFFLLISLSKFFQKALKDSIESPVLKLIYQSLNPNIRHEVQARVDGTINEIAALSSGVFLTLLGFIGFFSLINYTHVLLGIILIWLYVSYKLFQGYRRTLKETLEKASQTEKKQLHKAQWLEAVSEKKTIHKYSIIEITKPWLLIDSLVNDIAITNGEELITVCQIIKDRGEVSLLSSLEKRVGKVDDSKDKDTISDTIAYLNSIIAEANNEELIKEVLSSKNYEDRIIAAQYIGASTDSNIRRNLTFLLRDLVPAVKKQAIWAARGSRSKEIISFLIDFLDKDFYAPLAHAALIGSGEIGLEMLMVAFNRTNASEVFRNRIVRIIPETESAIAQNVLFGKLSIHSNLKTAVLDGLLKLDFSADDHEGVALHQMIIDQSGVCAWNLNMLYHCPPENIAPGLKEELDYNYSLSRNNLFQLLKLQYDKSSIDAVIENLEAGTGESISFAIELLDTFVVEDLKPYIIPLLEDATLANKIWALQNYYPLRTYTTEEMLKAIINRNENLITKYSKIYALNAFSNIEDLSLSADLTAQLFNTDRVLRQLSAQIIANIDQNKFLGFKKRMNDKLRVELDRMLEMSCAVGSSMLERLSFYRSISVNTEKQHSPLFWLYSAGVIRLSDVNIFELGIFKSANHILLIESGELIFSNDNQQIKTFRRGEIVVTKGLDTMVHSLWVEGSATIHFIDYTKFTAELYDHDFLTEYLTLIDIL
jgi:hypothetical protein